MLHLFEPRRAGASVTVIALLLLLPVPVRDAAAQSARAAEEPQAIEWTSLPEREQQMVTALLAAPDWPIRVFALLRLERYRGEQPAALVSQAARDRAWPVRCFAARQAQRTGVTLDQALFAREEEPRVVRAALRHGVALDVQRVAAGARKLLRTRALEELILGIELSAAIDDPALREEAAKRAAVLILNMDDGVAALAGRRLAAALGVHPPPVDGEAWRAWLAQRGHAIALPPARSTGAAPGLAVSPRSVVAQMDFEHFSRLAEYLDALRQRDLEMVIVMDCTTSMLPMLDGARAGVDALIQFLNDISRTMRLGFIAYYDHDNLEEAPVTRVMPMTGEIDQVRQFLFGVRIIGGRTLPEAVLDGLKQCRELDLNPRAARQVVVVGDAPPHAEFEARTLDLLAEMRYAGILVHAIHVPMRRSEEYRRMLTPGAAAADDADLMAYNASTAATFAAMARAGGGRMVTLSASEELVPSIMRFAVAEPWWPAFDDFYGAYLQLCR
jgi:hypothetical protein